MSTDRFGPSTGPVAGTRSASSARQPLWPLSLRPRLVIPVVFFIVGAAGLGLGLVHARVSGRRDRAVVAAGVRRYEGAALVLVVAATVAVVLSALSLWPGDLAIGILAGSGVWVIVAWWTLWWNEGRGPAETTMAATVDLLPGRFEAVPVGT